MSKRRASVTEAHLDQIRVLKAQGHTWAEVAFLLGLTEHQCRHQLPRLGFKPIHPSKFKDKQQNRIDCVPQAKPLPPGAKTLPPLPSLMEPIYEIKNR